jgi:hypothetical protein
MTSPYLNVSFYVPKSKWGRWIGKPDWHPDVAQASVWIRSFQLEPYLNRMGYKVSCNKIDPLPDIGIFLRRYNGSDVVLAKKIKAHGGKVVLDVVVNYFEPRLETSSGYGGASDTLVESFLDLVSVSDQIWAVSPFLQNLASKYHASSHFISDSVDPAHFSMSQSKFTEDNNPLIIGWSGIESKAYSLDGLSRILKKYISDNILKVLVITNRKPKLSFPFMYKKWNYTTFPKRISICDLCIAPRVVENNYDLGHSLYKIGVFMAMGIPALAGPIPSYNLLLEDHLAGEICDSMEAWEHHLYRYCSDHSLRTSAGLHASVKMKPYTTPNIVLQIDELMKSL